MGTMTEKRIGLLVDELVHHVPDLGQHAGLIRRIVAHLVQEKFEVSVRTDGVRRSSVTRNLDGSEGGCVRLSPVVGEDCLWDLAHEAGHLGEPAMKCDAIEQLQREEAAWKRGWELLTKMEPSIESLKERYENRREECLCCYRKAAERECAGTS